MFCIICKKNKSLIIWLPFSLSMVFLWKPLNKLIGIKYFYFFFNHKNRIKDWFSIIWVYTYSSNKRNTQIQLNKKKPSLISFVWNIIGWCIGRIVNFPEQTNKSLTYKLTKKISSKYNTVSNHIYLGFLLLLLNILLFLLYKTDVMPLKIISVLGVYVC